MKTRKDLDELTVKARATLTKQWGACQLKGRCWGKKNGHAENPFSGTNITLATQDELITINAKVDADGEPILIVHEFARTKSTELGKEIRKLLEKAKLI